MDRFSRIGFKFRSGLITLEPLRALDKIRLNNPN